jgi:hypothetical protein
MFDAEAALWANQKTEGRRKAAELVADINQWTTLHGPKDAPTESAPPSLGLQRSLFDYNEHFIELSNMGEEDRSLMFMALGLFAFGLCVGAWGAISITSHEGLTPIGTPASFLPFFGLAVFVYFLWPLSIAPNFFTALRPRYRFNRTAGKVYVLRPAKYGGNVILDWSRVRAHVNWCAPREMTWADLQNSVSREVRQRNGGGPMSMRGLVLYWPPIDGNDPERKGEEVLWVGPRFSGESLWQYIRTFMEDGIDAVPAPARYNWLRKGFSAPDEYLEETALGPSKALDEVTGRGPGMTTAATIGAAPFSPLHSLAERLCYWPTFPEEWNSDCGQKRREDDVGPEEPLRWKVN